MSHELAAKPSVSYDAGTELSVPIVPVVSQPLPLSLDDVVSYTQLRSVLADVGHCKLFVTIIKPS